MTTIIFMVAVALILSVSFVFCYLWALSAGQFNDLETPAHRILKDDFILKVTERKNHEQK
ncbi:MAG: cbb3-type cytochrome oxidase assembly protein CcoS [Bdellovibrionota bacterium]